MEFKEYQSQAVNTDQTQDKDEKDKIIIPLLGLISEAGSLLTEYKKKLRDGNAYQNFQEGVKEELGDLLWYVSNVATKFDLQLEDIAEDNLKKCKERFGWRDSDSRTSPYFRDKNYPQEQQLPRQFKFKIYEIEKNHKKKAEIKIYNEKIDKKFGATLTDNAYEEDYYRFHDVFHLSYAVHLGWSPVMRSNLERKRRQSDKVDEVEDGGRAIVIEEGISALVFSYAMKHNYLDGVEAIDYWLLKTIKEMTSHLEVKDCSMGDWEQAIFDGYQVWRQVREHKGGIIEADLDSRTMKYNPLL